MKTVTVVLLLWAAFLASVGSVLLKLGASGNTEIGQYINWKIGLAFCIYGAAVVTWLIGLSDNRLSTVYPFTAVSIVLVYLMSIAILGEPGSWRGAIGTAFVVLGVVLVVGAQR